MMKCRLKAERQRPFEERGRPGMLGRCATALCAALLAATFGFGAAAAPAKAPVYAGKQIRMVIASGAGGGYDVYARTFARHLVNHIPGHPNIVDQNMPGGGGLIGINWAYNVAPKDGSVILASFNAVLPLPLFGYQKAKFDPRKLAAIGSIGKQQHVCVTWHTSPIKTLDQVKHQQVTVSAEGSNSNSATLPLILNHMLGTKFKVITGYSTSGMRLALERGEVGGICGLSWSTLKASNPGWITHHRLNVLVQSGDKAQKGLSKVPLLVNLVPTAEDKRILRLLDFPGELGRPFFMPPGTPPAMVAVMRKAFNETMKDPAFLADAKKTMLEVDPVSGEEMHKIIVKAYNTPKALVEKAKPFSGLPGS